MKYNFYTLFPYMRDYHYYKDVGQIPFQINQLPFVKSTIKSTVVCIKSNDQLPSFRQPDSNINIINLSKSLFSIKSIESSIIIFLWRKAKYIDILNLFHFSIENLVYAFVYKFINPKGFLYIKLDLDYQQFRENHKLFTSFSSIKRNNKIIKYIKNKALGKLEYYFLRKIDLLSVELKTAFDFMLDNYFKDLFYVFRDKFIYIPNGLHIPTSPNKEKKHYNNVYKTSIISDTLKNNTILTVGRIGSLQKNVSMLMESLPLLKLDKWEIEIVGPVESNFHEYFHNFLYKYPNLSQKVFLIGEIPDRNHLFSYYQKARIFVSTSNFESFGFAILEALYNGCYIITTPVASVQDFLSDSTFGTVIPFNDPITLAKTLNNIIEKKKYFPNKTIERHLFAKNYFDWKNISLKLYHEIEKRIQ